MTQLNRVVEILERDGQIDNFQAIDTRLTLRLADIIFKLRGKGWEIRTEELPTKNTVYYVVRQPAPQQLAFA